jgi:hypothetical protein
MQTEELHQTSNVHLGLQYVEGNYKLLSALAMHAFNKVRSSVV